jgi:hypothetical protein
MTTGCRSAGAGGDAVASAGDAVASAGDAAAAGNAEQIRNKSAVEVFRDSSPASGIGDALHHVSLFSLLSSTNSTTSLPSSL